MRALKLPQEDFISATEGVFVPILRHSVRELPPARPLYETLSREEYRLWQYKQQRAELAENMENAANPETVAALPPLNHQRATIYTKIHRAQAAMQSERGFAFKL